MAEQWPTSLDAKIMTARSPDDSAGEHNKGSGWTANLPSEGGRNETEWSVVSLAMEVNGICGYCESLPYLN
jgi:hypothetical protein